MNQTILHNSWSENPKELFCPEIQLVETIFNAEFSNYFSNFSFAAMNLKGKLET